MSEVKIAQLVSAAGDVRLWVVDSFSPVTVGEIGCHQGWYIHGAIN